MQACCPDLVCLAQMFDVQRGPVKSSLWRLQHVFLTERVRHVVPLKVHVTYRLDRKTVRVKVNSNSIRMARVVTTDAFSWKCCRQAAREKGINPCTCQRLPCAPISTANRLSFFKPSHVSPMCGETGAKAM